MTGPLIGVIGATSLVGECLLSRDALPGLQMEPEFIAFTSRPLSGEMVSTTTPSWYSLSDKQALESLPKIEHFIFLAPIWLLSDYFTLFEQLGVRRIVALSSTSLYTKAGSPDKAEQKTVSKLIEGESSLTRWAEQQGVGWILLRPTLIYGMNRDKNIAAINRFISRFGFFPLAGKSSGLRQPVHANDVATACLQALYSSAVINKAYNISGGETLSYREMVERVFASRGKRPRIICVPEILVKAGVLLAKMFPRYRETSPAMISRIKQDMVFDHQDAVTDFGFSPGIFRLDETNSEG
jgi:hypothetical protein